MWYFWRQRPRRARHPTSLGGSSGVCLPVRVISSLSPDRFRVIVGEGIGLIYCHEADWPAE